MLDNLSDARFVIFEQSGHNALEEEHETFISTLRAFVGGDALAVPSYTSRDQVP